MGTIDYLCNAFAPRYADEWDAAIARQGVPVKVRRDPDDAFCEPDAMVVRMDELGIETLLVVTGDPQDHPGAFDFSALTARLDDMRELVASYPGRFAALWCLDANLGMDGVSRATYALEYDCVVGLYNHGTRGTGPSTTPTSLRTTPSPPTSTCRSRRSRAPRAV